MSERLKTTPDSNLPGLNGARRAFDIVSQMFDSHLDAWNKIWGGIKSGNAKEEYWGTAAEMVERYYQGVSDLIRLPFSSSNPDVPGWAIFRVPTPLAKVPTGLGPITVPLGRSYPPTAQLHTTQLQKLGGGGKSATITYHAELVPGGSQLLVSVEIKEKKEHPDGDYVGFVTLPGATAPLAVVMVSLNSDAS